MKRMCEIFSLPVEVECDDFELMIGDQDYNFAVVDDMQEMANRDEIAQSVCDAINLHDEMLSALFKAYDALSKLENKNSSCVLAWASCKTVLDNIQ